MTVETPGAFCLHDQRPARAPRLQCPCFWDWIAKTKKVVSLLVALLLLVLLGHELLLLV